MTGGFPCPPSPAPAGAAPAQEAEEGIPVAGGPGRAGELGRPRGSPAPITGSVEGLQCQDFNAFIPRADCHLSGSWGRPSVRSRIEIPGFVK